MHNIFILSRFCSTQGSAQLKVLLNSRFCSTQGSAQLKVLLNSRFCSTQGSVYFFLQKKSEQYLATGFNRRIFSELIFCF